MWGKILLRGKRQGREGFRRNEASKGGTDEDHRTSILTF